MQGWWFGDRLGLKSVSYSVFIIFPLFLKVFININEYANSIIQISDHKMKGM